VSCVCVCACVCVRVRVCVCVCVCVCVEKAYASTVPIALTEGTAHFCQKVLGQVLFCCLVRSILRSNRTELVLGMVHLRENVLDHIKQPLCELSDGSDTAATWCDRTPQPRAPQKLDLVVFPPEGVIYGWTVEKEFDLSFLSKERGHVCLHTLGALHSSLFAFAILKVLCSHRIPPGGCPCSSATLMLSLGNAPE